MNGEKNNKKVHNPKSHAPAVYIPCWLIQVPNTLLSFAAKVLYGRLSQWSNSTGNVYRSYNQLAEEIGSNKRSVSDYLKELREVGLIDTVQPQAGGLNHFIFYDHPWMYEKLNDQLCYKSSPDQGGTSAQDRALPPEQDPALPHAESCATPTQNPARINKKEIKENKNNKDLVDFASPNATKTKKCFSNYKDDKRFMRFYSEYPRKQKPRDAYKAFNQIIGNDDVLLDAVIEDLINRKQKDHQWSDKQYIPLPASYLRGGVYEGEILDKEQMRKDEKAKREMERLKKTEEMERLSRERRDYEESKQKQYAQDKKIYTAIQKDILTGNKSKPSPEFKSLMNSLKGSL